MLPVWALVTAGWLWRVAYDRWPEYRGAFGIGALLGIVLVAWWVERWLVGRRPPAA